jgi:hypothetical protein
VLTDDDRAYFLAAAQRLAIGVLPAYAKAWVKKGVPLTLGTSKFHQMYLLVRRMKPKLTALVKPFASSTMDAPNVSTTSDELSVPSDEALEVKRGRGRPRKEV